MTNDIPTKERRKAAPKSGTPSSAFLYLYHKTI